MLDVGFAFVEFVDFGFVDVEAQNLITDVHITEHQRQADIAQADDADFGGFICKFLNGNIFHDKSHVMEKGVPHSAKCRSRTPAGSHKNSRVGIRFVGVENKSFPKIGFGRKSFACANAALPDDNGVLGNVYANIIIKLGGKILNCIIFSNYYTVSD